MRLFHRKKKSMAAVTLAAALLLGTVAPAGTAFAAGTLDGPEPCIPAAQDEAGPPGGGLLLPQNGLLSPVITYVTLDADAAAEAAEESESPDTVLYAAPKSAHAGSSSEYAVYTNDYFYHQLSETEKALYDRLYLICDTFLTGTASAYAYGGDYYTDRAACPGLSQQEIYEVAMIFQASNPQFYFLSDGWQYETVRSGSTGGATLYVRLRIYEDFASGTARAAATKRMFAVAEGMLEKIKAEDTAYGKEKMAHDLLCDYIIYDSASVEADGGQRHQSCYTAFVEGSSVCAGYAEAFALLLNAAGVWTVSLTSEKHEWNEVYLNGNWYVVDVTWDDQAYGTIYTFFNRSERAVLMYSSESYQYHTPEELWDTHGRPVCRTNYIAGFEQTMTPEDADPWSVLEEENLAEHADEQDISGGADTGSEDPANTGGAGDPEDPDPAGGEAGETPESTEDETQIVVMYRLYDSRSGEHLYTSDYTEILTLLYRGWMYEGVGWEAPAASGTPVYRLYNSYSGEHHFTTDPVERRELLRIGWQDEGIGWYSYEGTDRELLYRVYNPYASTNTHLYTTDWNEVSTLVSRGWRYEGIAWYGMDRA